MISANARFCVVQSHGRRRHGVDRIRLCTLAGNGRNRGLSGVARNRETARAQGSILKETPDAKLYLSSRAATSSALSILPESCRSARKPHSRSAAGQRDRSARTLSRFPEQPASGVQGKKPCGMDSRQAPRACSPRRWTGAEAHRQSIHNDAYRRPLPRRRRPSSSQLRIVRYASARSSRSKWFERYPIQHRSSLSPRSRAPSTLLPNALRTGTRPSPRIRARAGPGRS